MRIFIVTLLLIGLVAPPIFAGAFDPTAVGPRAVGMGTAFTALADDATAIYWNPAGITQINGHEMVATYTEPHSMRLIRDNFIGYVQNGIADGSIGIGYKGLGTTSKVDFLKYLESSTFVTYSRKFFKKISLGISVKYLRTEMKPDKMNVNMITGVGYGFDLGILFHWNDRIQFGAAVSDLNQPYIHFDPNGAAIKIPYKARAGAAFRPTPNFNIDAEVNLQQDETAGYRLGAEYWLFNRRIAFRGGVQKVNSSSLNLASGFSLDFHKMLLEYGFISHPDLNLSHHLGLRMRF